MGVGLAILEAQEFRMSGFGGQDVGRGGVGCRVHYFGLILRHCCKTIATNQGRRDDTHA